MKLDIAYFRLDMPKSFFLPVPHHVPRHECVLAEGYLLVPQGRLNLSCVRTPKPSIQIHPLTVAHLCLGQQLDLPNWEQMVNMLLTLFGHTSG